MSDELSKAANEMALELKESLYQFDIPPPTNVWVFVHIPMWDKSEEDIQKIHKAVELLAEAGVTFDTGHGFGGMDWEWDYSLVGATVRLKKEQPEVKT